MSAKYPRPCATCGVEDYVVERALEPSVPWKTRLWNLWFGVRAATADPLLLCIDSDPRSDTHRRWWRCAKCGARYVTEVREEVNVGDLEGDTSDTGYLCERVEWERSLALARRCPRPNDAKCACPAHAAGPAILKVAWRVR